jgi:YYY domain-containing protein
MVEVLLALRWYLVLQLFGLAALPLCLQLFHRLPDRGYGFARPLGLLVGGWLFWLFTTLGWTHNTAGGILTSLLLLFLAGILLRTFVRVLPALSKPGRQVVAASELLFALSFALWCVVRAYMPRIETGGGEKWMEIAFLRAVLRSQTFPPYDPWLSGFAISYYYFGYVMMAMVTRLAAVSPSIAFNLGIATLFALTCNGAFSLVYNLVAACAPDGQKARAALTGGLLGVLLVALVGNLGGLLEVLHARGIGPAAFWKWLDIRELNTAPVPFSQGSWIPSRFFWWWRASRVVQDYTPWGDHQEVIDEFPAFSFILGDMHPHLLGLPFTIMAMALAFNLYLRPHKPMPGSDNAPVRLSFPLTWWEFAIYAICLGGLGFLNTWDFPIHLFIVLMALGLASYNGARVKDWLVNLVMPGGGLLFCGILLYLPFWIGFQSQAGGVLINLFNPTRLPQFLVMFGPVLFPVAVFVADRARGSRVDALDALRWTIILVVAILAIAGILLGTVMALETLGLLAPQGALAYLSAWLHRRPIPGLEGMANAHEMITARLLMRLSNPWTAFILALLLVTAILTLATTRRRNVDNFVLLLAIVGALLTLSVEYVYLRDHFGTRMNTVFKFYFQAWVMWGIAGAYALTGALQRKSGLAMVALVLIVAGMVYPVLAIPARAREYGSPPTLDGSAYLAQTNPDDYAAILWLNEHVEDAPVILEAPGDHYKAYVYEGRVSAHTGLPTLLGWGGHEHQWRGNYDEQARREPDIEAIYTSPNVKEVAALLDRYNVKYVYVGPVERARYPAAGLARFDRLLKRVYENAGVVIYQR